MYYNIIIMISVFHSAEEIQVTAVSSYNPDVLNAQGCPLWLPIYLENKKVILDYPFIFTMAHRVSAFLDILRFQVLMHLCK